MTVYCRKEVIGDCVVPEPMLEYVRNREHKMIRDNTYLIGNKHAKGSKPNKTAFPKGHEPWNKGKKGMHSSPATEFKKGCVSNRILPIGTETVRKCRNGMRRAFVKVANPSEWRERAKINWEKENGPIPAGRVIHHKDRDVLNDAIENLAALTRAEHINEHRTELRRHSL